MRRRHIAALVLLSLFSAAGLRAQRVPSDNAIRFFEWKISRDPGDFFNYDRLGAAYIRKGRETGDVNYYDLAEKALNKSLALESTHREAITATVHLASVYFSEHRFKQALEYAQKSLAFGTGDLSPYAIIGDASLEMGKYDDAVAAYSKLQEDEESPAPHQGLQYLKTTRNANLDFLRGNVQESIQLMRKAVDTAIASQMPNESIAWTQFTLGEEFFQEGDLNNAELAYQAALTTYPGYHMALAGLAKIRAAQGRFQDSIELYRKALAVIPLPTYAAALGDVYTKVGLSADAKKEYELVEFIGYLSALSKSVFNRELAIFYSDRQMKLKESLELAQKELEVRRDIYTWDCLAWALYRNGRASEAADASAKALAMGTKDALLYFHAGMIYLALHDENKAKDYFTRALSTNPHFHVLYADVAARNLREIGRSQQHDAQ